MNQLRVWIVLLALVSGLAGFAAGRLTAPPVVTPDGGPFADYRARMVTAFDLTPDRERALEVLLDRYQRDVEALKTQNLERHQPELVRLGDTYRGWIRDKVLPREQRARFDAMVAASPASYID